MESIFNIRYHVLDNVLTIDTLAIFGRFLKWYQLDLRLELISLALYRGQWRVECRCGGIHQNGLVGAFTTTVFGEFSTALLMDSEQACLWVPNRLYL